MKNQSYRLKLLISATLATGSGLTLAQDFDFANDGRLTAPIYRYGDTAGNGQFWDGQELGDNNLQFQYTGAGQAGTYIFGIDGTFTTPSINVLNGSNFGSIIFGDTGGNGQLWSQQELADNTFQLIYSAQPNPNVAPEFIFSPQGFFRVPILQFGDLAGNNQFWTQQELQAAATDVDNVPGGNTLQLQYSGAGQAGTFNFGVTGVFETPILQLADGPAANGQIWTQQEIAANQLQVLYSAQPNPDVAPEFIFSPQGFFRAPVLQLGDLAGNGQFWTQQELLDAVTAVDNVPGGNTLQIQYSGAGQAGTFNFGVTGVFEAPIVQVADTGGNGQVWTQQELANQTFQLQYSGAGQAGTYIFGVDGTLTTPVLQLGDTGANNQFWTQQELANQTLQVQYSGAGQAGTYIFGVDGTFLTPVLQLGDTGGNGQVWDLEELADNALQIQYSGAGLAGTYNFGVDGTFLTPILQLGDTGGNGQFWSQQELADQTFQLQYSGAGQAGTYNFGVDGTFLTPILQFGDTGGNNQFWDLEELVDNSFQIQYSGAGQAGTYNFGTDGVLEVPVLQLADTGGNNQIWNIEELIDNNLEIVYSGNPGPEVPSYIFGVDGTLTVPTLVETSDAKYKENVAPLNNALDTINALEGVSFNWKDSGRESIGFVAQDIEQVVPQLVHTATDGSKAVEYSKLVAVLVEALKEQQKMIDAQTNELVNLRTQMTSVNELQARLGLLEELLLMDSNIQLTQVSQ